MLVEFLWEIDGSLKIDQKCLEGAKNTSLLCPHGIMHITNCNAIHIGSSQLNQSGERIELNQLSIHTV